MFFNKLLVAVDDSEPSQYAIDISIIVAQHDGCPVIFCLVLDPAIMPQNYGFDSICELAEAKAKKILDAAVERAGAVGVKAASKTIYRNPSQGIIDVARAENVDLIVMGTHGRSGIARAVLSSVAETVLRNTKTPLCVVRRPPIGKIYSRFVVPICADELGQAATNYAIELARNFDSSLLFCTVARGADTKAELQLLESAEKAARGHGINSDSVLIQGRDDVADAILQQAGIQETDAIVMATHARDGLMRLMKGSVTEAVMRASLIPVVVVH